MSAKVLSRARRQASRTTLATPWNAPPCSFELGDSPYAGITDLPLTMVTQATAIQAHADFLRVRSRLHEVYLLERSRNHRLGLILGFVQILAAGTTVLVAPPIREVISYLVGAAMLVFSGGASGFGSIWAKAPGFSVGAGPTEGDQAPPKSRSRTEVEARENG